MEITLKEFFEKNSFRGQSGNFKKAVQDLTLEQFLNTCQRGDWISYLFDAMKGDWRKLTEARFHCANLIRDKIKNKDVRIVWAMNAALRVAKNPFYEDPGNKEYLEKFLHHAIDARKLAAQIFNYHYALNSWSDRRRLEYPLSSLGISFANIEFYFKNKYYEFRSDDVVKTVCK